MRPMPQSLSVGTISGNSDPMADWIEDYVLETVTSEWPRKAIHKPVRDWSIWTVVVERREDYYAVKVFSPKEDWLSDLGALAEKIEDELEARGVRVAVYPELRAQN